jgi:hypothetical protein
VTDDSTNEIAPDSVVAPLGLHRDGAQQRIIAAHIQAGDGNHPAWCRTRFRNKEVLSSILEDLGDAGRW